MTFCHGCPLDNVLPAAFYVEKIGHAYIECMTLIGEKGQLVFSVIVKCHAFYGRISIIRCYSDTLIDDTEIHGSEKPFFFCGMQISLARVPLDFTTRRQKLKSLPALVHVHQLFQRYKEFLEIRRWRSSDLDTLPIRDSAMNSQTVSNLVIPHVSKPTSNPKHFASIVHAKILTRSRIV